MAERFQEQHIVIHGDRGTLEIDVPFTAAPRVQGARSRDDRFEVLPIPRDLTGNSESGQSVFEVLPWVFQTQPAGARHFIDAIVNNSGACPSFADGYRAQLVIDAAMKSSAAGCWVSVFRYRSGRESLRHLAAPIIETVLDTRGLFGVEIALSPAEDPSLSTPEVVETGLWAGSCP